MWSGAVSQKSHIKLWCLLKTGVSGSERLRDLVVERLFSLWEPWVQHQQYPKINEQKKIKGRKICIVLFKFRDICCLDVCMACVMNQLHMKLNRALIVSGNLTPFPFGFSRQISTSDSKLNTFASSFFYGRKNNSTYAVQYF